MMLAGLSVINREKLLQLFQKHTKESTTLRPTEEGLFGRKVQPNLGSNFCFVKGVHEKSAHVKSVHPPYFLLAPCSFGL